MRFANRVTALLGVEIPILQAPMGYIAKPALVSAVSYAGAMAWCPGRSASRRYGPTSAAPASSRTSPSV
jgi:NAD(P)H-dependent flavin oxidoreductase YrpB (nitropropane dioxygenase family)